MKLLIDRRDELSGKAGVHALIVGISAYPNLAEAPGANFAKGLRVPGGATSGSAVDVSRWLTANRNSLRVPLVTCRLLLSPMDGAAEIPAEMQDAVEPATTYSFMQAANDWRTDLSANKDSLAFLYFCGLGVSLGSENLLLFTDFGDRIGPALKGSVSVTNVFNGMSPSGPQEGVARTQLYFIDCGRTFGQPIGGSYPTQVFDEYRPGPDDRNAVIFYAARPGESALAIEGERTLFSMALLRCLDGEAAVYLNSELDPNRAWGVTVSSLMRLLQNYTFETDTDEEVRIETVVGGLVRDDVIRYLPSPRVRAVIEVKSGGKATHPSLVIENASGQRVHAGAVTGDRVEVMLEAGLYSIAAKGVDAQGRELETRLLAALNPPKSSITLVLP